MGYKKGRKYPKKDRVKVEHDPYTEDEYIVTVDGNVKWTGLRYKDAQFYKRLEQGRMGKKRAGVGVAGIEVP
jgi:hypothetical protein